MLAVLGLASGAPALLYQVVWTREVGLLAGSQIEAISVVLVAFFGGLALGSHVFGSRADRVRKPLRLYAGLEAAAGALAILSPTLLHGLGEGPLLGATASTQLLAATAVLLPITFLLGGTLPALLRAATGLAETAPRAAGVIVGANTAGAVLGVALAVAWIPWLGLTASVRCAGALALVIGAAAWIMGRGDSPEKPGPAAPGSALRRVILAGAAVAGVATLAFEVLAARAAALLLGSSLLAWALVLGLLLAGLALGNLLMAGRAARSEVPAADLGRLELGVAFALALAASFGVPSVATPSSGVHLQSLLGVCAWVLPPALLMGAAFPLFVRLAVGPDTPVGAGFGTVSALNTAGGIIGALLAPFVLLPAFGLVGALLFCAALNALLGVFFALRLGERPGAVPVIAGLAGLAIAAGLSLAPSPVLDGRQVVFAHHGRQATAAVVHLGGRRDLLVDGDTEASTIGNARSTEELLALLPLWLHPEPRRFLEVGFGSGITLGTATLFPLERIDCVEISSSVLRAARFFITENANVAGGTDDRVNIVQGDGRALLARRRGEYDVIVANTVHPWSVGATGLYSREYYGRIARALRPGGIAAQWLPVQQLGGDQLAILLRTFFEVFPEGGIFWGAESLLVIGSELPLTSDPSAPPTTGPAAALFERLGIRGAQDLAARDLGRAAGVRELLADTPVLSDDRPLLEVAGALRRARSSGGELALLEGLAQERKGSHPASGPVHLWLQSRLTHESGDTRLANELEYAAEVAGLRFARDARIDRDLRSADEAYRAGRQTEAERILLKILEQQPDHDRARFILANLRLAQQDLPGTLRELERLVASHPQRADAWNQLGAVRNMAGDSDRAMRAFEQALIVDPYYPKALGNVGLLALAGGDRITAEGVLKRLSRLGPLGPSAEELALREALTRR